MSKAHGTGCHSIPAKHSVIPDWIRSWTIRLMTLVTVALLALSVTACRTNYQMTLNNGNRITTSTKPKLVNGYYVFMDLQGRTNYVAEGRVRAIEPQPRGFHEEPNSPTYQKR